MAGKRVRELGDLKSSGQAQRARVDQRRLAGRCYVCNKRSPTKGDLCDICHHNAKQSKAKSLQRTKQDVFDRYGGNVCACCGETKGIDFLQIDHVNGRGSQHKTARGIRLTGLRLYAWLRRNNFPAGFQGMSARALAYMHTTHETAPSFSLQYPRRHAAPAGRKFSVLTVTFAKGTDDRCPHQSYVNAMLTKLASTALLY